MGFLRGLVTRNLFLKVASLGLAVLLWTVVRVESPERQTLPGVPVRIAVALTQPQQLRLHLALGDGLDRGVATQAPLGGIASGAAGMPHHQDDQS